MSERAPLPESVRIGHLIYSVRIDQVAMDDEYRASGRRLSGMSQMSSQQIVLSEGQPLQYERDTVLHEIIHQCFRVSGTDPDNDAAARLEDVEERAVASITGPLLGTLQDNPDLVAYLLG